MFSRFRLFEIIASVALLALACGFGLGCAERRERAAPGAEAPAIAASSSPGARGAEAANADCDPSALGTAACPAGSEVAILAGGCFWGMEEILRQIPGVLATDVGYAGGHTSAPTYDDVRTGMTGHAESVRIVFDPARLSYAELLERWFFRMHDPTTKNRQGNDVGTQYRSAIFYTSPAQQRTAEEVLRRVGASGKWPAPLVTEISAAGPFTRAEDYHQDYLQKHPGGYTCHYLRD